MGVNIKKRNVSNGSNTQDLGIIGNIVYSQPSGANKVAEVGRHLLPLAKPGVGTGYTTDVSGGAYSLPAPGRNLAIYNNSAAVHAVTFGTDNTVTALAAGVTDSSGRVGLPCMPNSWNYFAGGFSNWVITDSATLMVFLINDDTNIQVVSTSFDNTNGNPV